MAKGKMRVTVEVKDKGLGEAMKRIEELKSRYAKVGILADDNKGGAEHKNKEGQAAKNLTNAQLAVWMEYGTSDGHVPARPFVRSTYDQKQGQLQEMGEKLMGQVIDGRMDVDRALGLMGAFLAAEIKKTVTTGTGVEPANKPSTIERKGSSRPLVDTGQMIGSVTWVIDKNDKEK